MAQNYNLENIRTLLIESFTDRELRDFCFDTPNFKPVYHELAEDSGKAKIVSRLLEHAEQRLLIDQLLAWAKAHNRPRYEQHQPYFTGPISPPELPVHKTILIPAGPFLMGNPKAVDEWQQHRVTLTNYEISKYPVTNEQYAKFVEVHPERRPDKVAGWRFTKLPTNKFKHPVVGVSYDDAMAYCTWLSRQTGQSYRLPTEAEWEKAARGDQDSRIYPWGDEFSPDYCNYGSTQTTPVDQYEAGRSPYGCFDMVGNVRELTSTLWGEDWRKASFTYPYQKDDREALKFASIVYRIYRGGAYNDDVTQLGCSARGIYAPNTRTENLGFRVVLVI